MEYFFYSVDLDMFDSIRKMVKANTNEEDILYEIKANGEYLKSYDEKNYIELIGRLGTECGGYLAKKFIDLSELKKMYKKIKKDFSDEMTRDYKIMIYKAIGESKGIIIWNMQVSEEEKLGPSNSKFQDILENMSNKFKNILKKPAL